MVSALPTRVAGHDLAIVATPDGRFARHAGCAVGVPRCRWPGCARVLRRRIELLQTLGTRPENTQSVGLLGHEIQQEFWAGLPAGGPACGVLSGPSFALEVARGQPTALVAASRQATVRDSRLWTPSTAQPCASMRTTDIAGVEVGGAGEKRAGHRHRFVRRPAAGPECPAPRSSPVAWLK